MVIIICPEVSTGFTMHQQSIVKMVVFHFIDRSNSRNADDASQVVSKHLSECGKGFHVLPLYKLKEENKIACLVKEDIFIKLLMPDLNRDSRHLKLKALLKTKHYLVLK